VTGLGDKVVCAGKVLTANDVGETRSHQAGVHIPKGLEWRQLFGELDTKAVNPTREIEVWIPATGQCHQLRYIYFNGALFGTNSRDEYRLTSGTTSGATSLADFLKSLNARSGDLLQLCRVQREDGERFEAVLRRKSWLLLAKEKRQHGGNEGYEDLPSSSYVWDDTVSHHADLSEGDQILLWDGETLLGVSVIDRIHVGSDKKIRKRCPECKATNIKSRTTKQPLFRCAQSQCGNEFDVPKEESIEVRVYKSDHAARWVELAGEVDGTHLRDACLSPKSQHSIRQMDVTAVGKLIKDSIPPHKGQQIARAQETWGGHRKAWVRVRSGQGKFRQLLLAKYDNTCAFSGPGPPEALEACHLRSFAREGEHDSENGLLLRRDLHRLFDDGLIRVNPVTLEIAIALSLTQYKQYSSLDRETVRVGLTSSQRRWLREHWDQHALDGEQIT